MEPTGDEIEKVITSRGPSQAQASEIQKERQPKALEGKQNIANALLCPLWERKVEGTIHDLLRFSEILFSLLPSHQLVNRPFGDSKMSKVSFNSRAAELAAIVRAPLGNGAGVFAPNIKLGLSKPAAAGRARPTVNRSPCSNAARLIHTYVNRSRETNARRAVGVRGEPVLLAIRVELIIIRFGRAAIAEPVPRRGDSWRDESGLRNNFCYQPSNIFVGKLRVLETFT